MEEKKKRKEEEKRREVEAEQEMIRYNKKIFEA